jgi:GLPGLI family protein
MIGAVRFTAQIIVIFRSKKGKIFELLKKNDGNYNKKRPLHKINWEISTESKTTDGYLCYKRFIIREYIIEIINQKINRIIVAFGLRHHYLLVLVPKNTMELQV